MKKPIKFVLIILTSLFLVLIVALTVYLLSPGASDYGTFVEMRAYQRESLLKYQSRERKINHFFEDYELQLPLLYKIMFKAPKLSLFLKSYESDKIETATTNQLEIGTDSGNFFDFTFMIRPRSLYNVPFFHGDALKALPGVTSALYMDFYSFEGTIDPQYFFRNTKDKLEQALALAEPYWKTEGFGELTPHLDPFKSPWRLEMVEPEEGTEAEIKEYYETVFDCYSLYLDAYLEALDEFDIVAGSDMQEKNSQEIENFVAILYRDDIAVKMGKMIFPEEDFDKYFLEGFWGVGK